MVVIINLPTLLILLVYVMSSSHVSSQVNQPSQPTYTTTILPKTHFLNTKVYTYLSLHSTYTTITTTTKVFSSPKEK